MGNRHAHKQLRRAIRARMAMTGETYQQARDRILVERRPNPPQSARAPRLIEADLVPIRYFGEPAALATFEIAGRISVLVLSSAQRRAPFPLNPLLGLGKSRSVH